MTTSTRIHLTADQADVVARKLRRPNVLGAALQVGRHGYVELDLQARTTAGEPYGAIWEISPAGTWTLNAGEDPLDANGYTAGGNADDAHEAGHLERNPMRADVAQIWRGHSPDARRARGHRDEQPETRCGGCGRPVDPTTPRCEGCGFPDGAEMVAKTTTTPTLTLTVLSGPDDDPLIAVGGRMAADDAGTYLAPNGHGWARDDDHEPPHWLNEAMDHAFEEWSARSLQAAQAERAAGWPTTGDSSAMAASAGDDGDAHTR